MGTPTADDCQGRTRECADLSTGPTNPTHSPATNVTNLLRLTARPQGRGTDCRCSSSERRPRSALGSSPPGPSPHLVLRPPQGGRGPRTPLLMLCHCPECPPTPSPDHLSPVLLQGPRWCHLFQEASDTHAHTRVHTHTRTHLQTQTHTTASLWGVAHSPGSSKCRPGSHPGHLPVLPMATIWTTPWSTREPDLPTHRTVSS